MNMERKTKRIVRMPATKFPKLQKKLRTPRLPGKLKGKKPSS
jgi:hypothetical protein